MMNSSIIGKDPEGRYWFKSDQCLTDITDATGFYVKKIGWWHKSWQLIAIFTKRAAYFRDPIKQRVYVPAITEEQVLGCYNREGHASIALDDVMRIREIKEVDPLAGR